jgi:hypothetical protein
VTDQGNTPLDDFERLLRTTLARGQSAPAALPTEPPAELIQGYRTANCVVEYLAEQHVYLHFEVGVGGEQVLVQVMDKDGHVTGEISPLRLLDSLAGGHDLLLDANS